MQKNCSSALHLEPQETLTSPNPPAAASTNTALPLVAAPNAGSGNRLHDPEQHSWRPSAVHAPRCDDHAVFLQADQIGTTLLTAIHSTPGDNQHVSGLSEPGHISGFFPDSEAAHSLAPPAQRICTISSPQQLCFLLANRDTRSLAH